MLIKNICYLKSQAKKSTGDWYFIISETVSFVKNNIVELGKSFRICILEGLIILEEINICSKHSIKMSRLIWLRLILNLITIMHF